MRRTKIICTIGPATDSYDMLRDMHEQGMDIVRLNMSHGNHATHAKVIKAIKTLNHKVKFPVPILLDTQGPEIRTGTLEQDFELKEGSVVSITVRATDVEQSSIQINYEELIDTVEVGDRITVDNGLINLEVLEKNERDLQCRIIDGGTLGSRRHVNFPGIKVNLPAITKKDREDILFGMEQEVDFIALSFVRSADDIAELKTLLGAKAEKIKIIAKIEDQEGLGNIEAIARAADAVMVARGDLGVEIDIEDLPNVQRRIVKICHQYGKRVIVATHLLESMINNPIPTRAEVTDVANAIYEEVDAIMLSGETTVGKYPLKCIEYLDKIARKSEGLPGLNFVRFLEKDSKKQQTASAAVDLAESLEAKGIIVITRRGYTALFVANCRPVKTPIYAFTNDSRTRRQMVLNRGVRPFRIAFSNDPEKTLGTAIKMLKDKDELKVDDQVVVVSDVISGAGIETIQVRSITAEEMASDEL